MTELPKNVPASVHARLLAGASARGEDFNLTMQRYVSERFLYRLGASPYRQQFVLKGAMLFALWSGALYRATRDLDLTGYTKDNAEDLIAIVREICVVPCLQDGLVFHADSVKAQPIRDKSEYHGFRIKLDVSLGTAVVVQQIDVGFGDAIEPPAVEHDYPVLIGGPAPRVRAYSREAAVAEKLHAMVIHGTANSRFKDFYDVFVLASHFTFAGPVLARAITATFERRGTPLGDPQPDILVSDFYTNQKRSDEWRRYLTRNRLTGAPADFARVGDVLRDFFGPIWIALAPHSDFSRAWSIGGPWRAA